LRQKEPCAKTKVGGREREREAQQESHRRNQPGTVVEFDDCLDVPGGTARADMQAFAGIACSSARKPEGHFAQALSGQGEHGIRDCWRDRRHAGLANAPRLLAAGNDMDLDVRHFGEP
jgi:hypothetical protein